MMTTQSVNGATPAMVPTAQAFILEQLMENPGGLTSTDLVELRPDHMTPQTIYARLSALHALGVLGKGTVSVGGGSMPDRGVFKYWIADLDRVPKNAKDTITSRRFKNIRDAIRKQKNKPVAVAVPIAQPTLQPPPVHVEPPRPAPKPEPTGPYIGLPVDGGVVKLPLLKAREVFEQLKLVFGA